MLETVLQDISRAAPAPALPLWLMIGVSHATACPILLRLGKEDRVLMWRRAADLASVAVWPVSIQWRLTLPANDLDTSYLALGAAKKLAFVVDRRPTLPAECAGLMPHALELLAHQRWYV